MHRDPVSRWQLANDRALDITSGVVVAILNATPDSFHAHSRTPSPPEALARARLALEQGAHMLDIGGESTRPGAASIPADVQIARVVPVIEAIRRDPGPLSHSPISVDTSLAPVARAALDAGADAINDVSAGRDDPDMLPLVADRGAGIVLMHRLTRPAHDQYSHQYRSPPSYGDVVADVREFLRARAAAATDAGISPDRIVLDPGLGFGKSVEQNLELVRSTPVLLELGFPIMSAASRKSFLGVIGHGPGHAIGPAQRLPASVALSVMHWTLGARLFRVHDVAEHAQALSAVRAIHGDPPPESRRPV
ncbi:MAG: dihydropteroate synthase [Phycisphaeraceae bacterium]|nr:dihydropteroate synthase [Phycisphaeraceae bacterium]